MRPFSFFKKPVTKKSISSGSDGQDRSSITKQAFSDYLNARSGQPFYRLGEAYGRYAETHSAGMTDSFLFFSRRSIDSDRVLIRNLSVFSETVFMPERLAGSFAVPEDYQEIHAHSIHLFSGCPDRLYEEAAEVIAYYTSFTGKPHPESPKDVPDDMEEDDPYLFINERKAVYLGLECILRACAEKGTLLSETPLRLTYERIQELGGMDILFRSFQRLPVFSNDFGCLTLFSLCCCYSSWREVAFQDIMEILQRVSLSYGDQPFSSCYKEKTIIYLPDDMAFQSIFFKRLMMEADHLKGAYRIYLPVREYDSYCGKILSTFLSGTHVHFTFATTIQASSVERLKQFAGENWNLLASGCDVVCASASVLNEKETLRSYLHNRFSDFYFPLECMDGRYFFSDDVKIFYEL